MFYVFQHIKTNYSITPPPNTVFIRVMSIDLVLYDNVLLQLHCVTCMYTHAYSFLKIFHRDLYQLKNK